MLERHYDAKSGHYFVPERSTGLTIRVSGRAITSIKPVHWQEIASAFVALPDPCDGDTRHRTATVWAVEVDRDHRNQGVGFWLMDEVLRSVANLNRYLYVDLYVRKNNIGARRLYTKLGFTELLDKTPYYNCTRWVYNLLQPRDKEGNVVCVE